MHTLIDKKIISSMTVKEDRLIILQALFSRAETGLLKEDSSPTMPGTALERMVGIK